MVSCIHCYLASGAHSPEHLVQASFQEEGRYQKEILEVAQPEELRSNLGNMLFFLIFEFRHVRVRETESLHIAHLAQERSKHSQAGQMPGAVYSHLLNTVQLHHTQDLHNTVSGH